MISSIFTFFSGKLGTVRFAIACVTVGYGFKKASDKGYRFEKRASNGDSMSFGPAPQDESQYIEDGNI